MEANLSDDCFWWWYFEYIREERYRVDKKSYYGKIFCDFARGNLYFPQTFKANEAQKAIRLFT